MREDTRNLTWLLRGSIWALIVMLGVSALLLQARLVNEIDLDNGIIGDEGEMLYTLRAVRMGQPPYRDLSTEPHVLAPYMPLFYLLPGTLARWIGTNWIGTLVVGRGYIYALWIGVGAMVYALVAQAHGSRVAAGLAALLWLAGRLTPESANSFRPDSAMIFFSLAGVWLYQRSERTKDVVGSALLLVVAFLHKQSAVCAVSAILLDTLWQKRRKATLVVLGTWMTGVAIVLIAAQTLTTGAFGMNVFGSLLGWANWPHVEMTLTLAATRGAAVFAGAGVAAALPTTPRLLRTYFALAVALAMGSSAKFGSGSHYYLEAYAIGCALTGILVSEWLGRTAPNRIGLQIPWLAIALAASVLTLGPRLTSAPELTGEIVRHHAIRRQTTEEWERVLERLRAIGQPQLIEDVYLAVRSSTQPVLVNASMFASMQRNGRFDDSDIVRQINGGRFEAVVTTQPLDGAGRFRHFPRGWLELVGTRYKLADHYEIGEIGATFYIYLPRTTDAEGRGTPVD